MSSTPWILFDVGGVLERVDDGIWQPRFRDSLRARAGVGPVEFAAMVAAAELPRIDLEMHQEENYWRRLGQALSFDEDDVATVRAEFWDAYCGVLNSELMDFATAMPTQVGRAVLSNSVDGARDEEERRFGFSTVFDPVCYSHEMGVAKPDAAAYKTALARMGAEPRDVFFIDDHQDSIDGATALGIASILHESNVTTIAAISHFLAAHDPSCRARPEPSTRCAPG